MKPLADQAARDRIRHDLDSTLVVEAAAGTGKTTELVSRIMSVLREGKGRLSRVVAVTFTEKAAGEMKLRLRGEIEKARQDPALGPVPRARLDQALAELEAAHIGTIHSFCADLLRERPVEAGVDPLFEVAAEEETAKLYGETFDRWFQRELAAPREGILRVLRRRAKERDAHGPRDVLYKAGLDLVDKRDFDGEWKVPDFDRRGKIDEVIAQLDELVELSKRAADPDCWLAKGLAELALWREELERRERVRPRDHDRLEADLRELSRVRAWGWRGGPSTFAKGVSKQWVLQRRDEVKQHLERVLERAEAQLAAQLRRDLRDLVAGYEALKRRAGKLDFVDLLLLTRDLVRDRPAVRAELQRRFTHLLVDEFQDTDPLQAEILLLLSADDPAESHWQRVRPVPGKLFVVGDPKQAIYRFRRADVAVYQDIKQRLQERGASVLFLSTSFRSVPSIQQAVNAAFSPRMKADARGHQAEYVALSPFRDEPRGRPTVVALPVPRPYGDYGKVVKWQIEKSLPEAVGAFVHWLLRESGWTVTERERAAPGPIEARHVCLLFKRFQQFKRDVTREYVRALEARRVPHVLVGGRSYHAREEVQAIRNALRAIEWPDDDLSVYATLRGPFFALQDDQLLAYRHSQGTLHTLKAPDEALLDAQTRPVADCLAILKELHVTRNRCPIADTIAQLLERTRAHAGVAIWPTGEQALANLLRVMDLARRFEARGATSFRGFVVHLMDEAERGGAAEAPVVEEGTDGVRLMTVHKAKGLEFPVVILVDPTASATSDRPSRWVDPGGRVWAMPLAGCAPDELIEHKEEVLAQDRAEALRLLYVAATRARELLVVPVVGDEPVEGWVDPLHDVLYPPDETRRRPAPAPGCPPFGNDSVLDRGPKAERSTFASVQPGLHRPRAGEHRVVVWDPAALAKDSQVDAGLRQQRILEADEGGVASEGIRAHEAWQAKRTAVRERGRAPSQRVRTITEISADATASGNIPVAHEATSAPRAGRPHGRRFGTLVHAVLATIDLVAPADVPAIAKAQGRLVGATAEEIEAAATAALAALRHPVLARARAPGVEVRRECPVVVRGEDGVFVEGVLDLALREPGPSGATWTVVDFKTDAEVGARGAAYEAQVVAYARAVAETTGEAVRALLLRV